MVTKWRARVAQRIKTWSLELVCESSVPSLDAVWPWTGNHIDVSQFSPGSNKMITIVLLSGFNEGLAQRRLPKWLRP